MKSKQKIERKERGGCSCAAPCSAPLKWYAAFEIEDLLKESPISYVSDNYPFCVWLASHLNTALQKGYEMGQRQAQNDKVSGVPTPNTNEPSTLK